MKYPAEHDVVTDAPSDGTRASREASPEAETSSTRRRLVRTILHRGPSTAATLAAELGVTPAAVRRHLDQLVTDGLVQASPEPVRGPRGRGRPAKVFAVTSLARDTFEQDYDELALSALRYLNEVGGSAAVGAFAQRRVADLEERYAHVVATGGSSQERVQALAAALTDDGYAASAQASPATGGEQICQHHCPVAHVAEEFPELCDAETEVFQRLLGTHVQRIATIAHGAGVCTTHVPPAVAADTTEPPDQHDPQHVTRNSTAKERTTR